MSDRGDWLDDFIMMEMMEEDERQGSGTGSGSPGTGCLGRVCLAVVLFLLILGFFISFICRSFLRLP